MRLIFLVSCCLCTRILAAHEPSNNRSCKLIQLMQSKNTPSRKDTQLVRCSFYYIILTDLIPFNSKLTNFTLPFFSPLAHLSSLCSFSSSSPLVDASTFSLLFSRSFFSFYSLFPTFLFPFLFSNTVLSQSLISFPPFFVKLA